MKQAHCSCPGCEDGQDYQRIANVIDLYRDRTDNLIQVLHLAQEWYGFIPLDVQKMIADGMDIPLEKVYGVSTFYAQFALSPAGKYAVSVCLGTACYVKGAQAVFDHLQELLGIGPGECTADGLFSLEACRCIGACGLAPVMMINDEVYGNLTPDMLEDILAKYQE